MRSDVATTFPVSVRIDCGLSVCAAVGCQSGLRGREGSSHVVVRRPSGRTPRAKRGPRRWRRRHPLDTTDHWWRVRAFHPAKRMSTRRWQKVFRHTGGANGIAEERTRHTENSHCCSWSVCGFVSSGRNGRGKNSPRRRPSPVVVVVAAAVVVVVVVALRLTRSFRGHFREAPARAPGS